MTGCFFINTFLFSRSQHNDTIENDDDNDDHINNSNFISGKFYHHYHYDCHYHDYIIGVKIIVPGIRATTRKETEKNG